ncbi:MAG: DUF4430 domain-containing protein [Lachnospiraceae bacterium]
MKARKVLAMVFVATMVVSITACSKEEVTEETNVVEAMERSVVGEGESTILFDVVFEDGTCNSYEVKTDAEIVGEGLLEAGLIEGEDSEYGLYVKTVDGVTLDYDKDAAYWGFFIDGEMAYTGVDQTELVEGTTYSFEYAK